MGNNLDALAHQPFYDLFCRWYDGDPEVSGVASYTGMEVLATEEGLCRIAFTPDKRHANAANSMQGGVLAAVADAAIGTALASTLKENEFFTTVEMKMNFLRPSPFHKRLEVEGKVVHRGRSMAYMECTVTNEEGKLVARINSSSMIVQTEPG
ncbi:MAG: PaaI family thioesterase [bacterium]